MIGYWRRWGRGAAWPAALGRQDNQKKDAKNGGHSSQDGPQGDVTGAEESAT
jgi:hypothetical protein